MSTSLENLADHLLTRLAEVQNNLGLPDVPNHRESRFADVLDSMAMVEFLAILTKDCGLKPGAIEHCVNHHFGTVGELAKAMHAAGLVPCGTIDTSKRPTNALQSTVRSPFSARSRVSTQTIWLAATAVRLPEATQSADVLNEALGRPSGWLQRHAGIQQRRIWINQDPLAAAADAGRECLQRAGLAATDVGALLVTSEAPPLLVGLAAAVHHQLRLGPDAVALEIGNACSGFLAALWMAQTLLPRVGVVLVVAIEAPTRYLQLTPGPAGEAAALFGDAAAAAVVCADPSGPDAISISEVCLRADGDAGPLLKLERSAAGVIELHMSGITLANRAVHVMAESVSELLQGHGLSTADLTAVVAHGGNGRLPALLARRLGLSPERVWSQASSAGNLGSASLPTAWALRESRPKGPAIWTAVGAGLTWGAALIGEPPS